MTEVRVREISKPSKHYSTFQIKLGTMAQELQEGLGSGQEQLVSLNKQISDFRQDFGDYRGEFKDYRQEFKDYKEEFRDYRQEFRDFATRTDANFSTMDSKYGEISTKLTQMLEVYQRENAETRAELKKSVENLSRLVDEFIEFSRKGTGREKETS